MSRSLFAGLEVGSGVVVRGGEEGSVRGIVLTSRSFARMPALDMPGIGNGSFVGRDWSMVEESQLSPAAAVKVMGADSAACLASLDFLSQAARAVWSTGHAWSSEVFAIVYIVLWPTCKPCRDSESGC